MCPRGGTGIRAASRVLRSQAALVLVVGAIASVASQALSGRASAQLDQAPPNIVLILTDDQRADTLRYMPHVRRQLGRHGLTFADGYVVNPTCCPSRASILTGNYSHTTGIYLNHSNERFGGFDAFDDHDTIATRLHDAGYRTGLFGKYLNGYNRHVDYVPPGWDEWFSTFRDGYFDYKASVNGVRTSFGHARSDYGVTVLNERVHSFISTTDPTVPFFAYIAPHNPHEPAIPAPGDRDRFASLPRFRPRSYDEADVSDKPAHMRSIRRLSADDTRRIDAFRLDQIRSLLAVDRLVGDVVAELRERDVLSNTLIVFTSDNGMLWGEHRLDGKGVIYEEATRVPFVIRYDALVQSARRDAHLVLNIDLAPTFAEAAGIALASDGVSLVPLLDAGGGIGRAAFLIEHLRADNDDPIAPTFCAVHTRRFVLARYETGEEELYDLSRDPLEMISRAGRRQYHDVQRRLEGDLRSLCRPAPPGYSF